MRVVYSLIGTTKLNNIDAQVWRADVLARIADIPQSRLREILPWTWAGTTALAGVA